MNGLTALRGLGLLGLDAPPTVVEGLAAAREIRSGAEAAAGAGDDDRADLVVNVGAVEGLDQLARHRLRPRVETLGTVQRDRENALGELPHALLVFDEEENL